MRDDFPLWVQRKLALRVAHRCSRPECRAITSGPQEGTEGIVNIGVAAHVTAASPGGPRYDPGLTPQQRRSAANGVWLCQSCAKLADSDEARYTVEVLRSWKRWAEEQASSQIGRTQPQFEDDGGPEPPYIVNSTGTIPWLNMTDTVLGDDPQIQILREKGYYIGGGAVSSLGTYLSGGSEYILWKQPNTGKLFRLFAGMGMEPGPFDNIWLMRKL